jgi:hypothetical protein
MVRFSGREAHCKLRQKKHEGPRKGRRDASLFKKEISADATVGDLFQNVGAKLRGALDPIPFRRSGLKRGSIILGKRIFRT